MNNRASKEQRARGRAVRLGEVLKCNGKGSPGLGRGEQRSFLAGVRVEILIEKVTFEVGLDGWENDFGFVFCFLFLIITGKTVAVPQRGIALAKAWRLDRQVCSRDRRNTHSVRLLSRGK